jgi:hypothetical protein
MSKAKMLGAIVVAASSLWMAESTFGQVSPYSPPDARMLSDMTWLGVRSHELNYHSRVSRMYSRLGRAESTYRATPYRSWGTRWRARRGRVFRWRR